MFVTSGLPEDANQKKFWFARFYFQLSLLKKKLPLKPFLGSNAVLNPAGSAELILGDYCPHNFLTYSI